MNDDKTFKQLQTVLIGRCMRVHAPASDRCTATSTYKTYDGGQRFDRANAIANSIANSIVIIVDIKLLKLHSWSNAIGINKITPHIMLVIMTSSGQIHGLRPMTFHAALKFVTSWHHGFYAKEEGRWELLDR